MTFLKSQIDNNNHQISATILVADKPVSKQYRQNGSEFVKTAGYPKILHWKRKPVSINDDIDELFTMLQGIPQNAALTMSVVCGDIPLNQPARRLATDKGSDKATLALPDSSTCFVLDIDDWALNDPFNTLDPREQIEQVREALGLGAYSCVWQLTSSARFGSMYLKARLWFLTDSPVQMPLLKAAAGVLGADESVYNAAQIIYTAAPVFTGGTDPIPNRWGTLLSDEDAIPHYVIRQIACDADKKVKGGEYMGDVSDFPRMGFNQALGYLGDGDGLRGFHEVLRRFTLLAVKRNIKRENIKARCREAIAEAPKSLSRDKNDIKRYMSDTYLDDLINGAESWINGHDTLPPRHAIKPQLPTVTLDESKKIIDKILDDFINEPATTVLKLTVGGGKTHSTVEKVVEFLVNNAEGNIIWFAPTHRQGVEVEEKLNNLYPGAAIRIRGRLHQESEGGPTPCGRPELIRAVQAKGLSKKIKSICCETHTRMENGDDMVTFCPLWNECQYYRQFMGNHRVRILPHEYINYPSANAFTWNGWDEGVVLTIVDESPVNTIIGNRAHNLDDVKAIGGAMAETVEHVINGTTPDNIETLIESISKQFGDDKQELPSIGASMSEKGLINYLEAFKPDPLAKYIGFASSLIRWLQGDKNLVWLGNDGRIHYAWHKEAELLKNAMILDATAHHETYKAALGEEVKFAEINVKQNLYVVQISDEVISKHALKNPALVTRLGGLATISNAGLITHKAAIEQLSEIFPGHTIPTAHFMALRGINRMENFQALVIAGRIEPSAAVVEAKARALYPREELNFTGAYEWQRGEFGGVVGHSDPRIDAVLRDIREGEMDQAIGRLRAVRADTPKLLIVATNAPSPIKPDVVITADEILPDSRFSAVAIRDGVFIQSDKWLSNQHPDLFESDNAAKKWLSRSDFKGVESLIKKYLYKENDPLKFAEFRVQGQRGSLAKAVMWADELATIARIEELTQKEVTIFISKEIEEVKTPVVQAQPGQLLKQPQLTDVIPPNPIKQPALGAR